MKKYIVGHIAFYALAMLFLVHYLIGARGVYYVHMLKKINEQLRQDIAQQKHEINSIAAELSAWQRYDFFKEQLAREQLQLAYADDVVYYLS